MKNEDRECYFLKSKKLKKAFAIGLVLHCIKNKFLFKDFSWFL